MDNNNSSTLTEPQAFKPGLILKAIPAIMLKIEPIYKDRQGNGYKFRGIDDVYAVMNLLLARNGVTVIPEVISEQWGILKTNAGKDMTHLKIKVRYTLFAEDGSYVTVHTIGEAMDNSDKASGKAMSTAYKYMAFEVFCIPTDSKLDVELEDLQPEPIVPAPSAAKTALKAVESKLTLVKSSGPADYKVVYENWEDVVDEKGRKLGSLDGDRLGFYANATVAFMESQKVTEEVRQIRRTVHMAARQALKEMEENDTSGQ